MTLDPTRRFTALAAAAALLAGLPAAQAQGPATPPATPSVPAPDAPNTIPDIRGPDGVFTLLPDGATWVKFQTLRQIGVRCTDKACGGERVFCAIQTRTDATARPGVTLSDELAKKFGEGVIATAPKELTAAFIAPFAPKRFGPNEGQWAEVKAEGAPGALRFGLFLVAAKGYDVAFNCVTPLDRWDAHKPKIETLLGQLKIAP